MPIASWSHHSAWLRNAITVLCRFQVHPEPGPKNWMCSLYSVEPDSATQAVKANQSQDSGAGGRRDSIQYWEMDGSAWKLWRERKETKIAITCIRDTYARLGGDVPEHNLRCAYL